MNKKGRLIEYLAITSIVWGWYATLLPAWMYYFIGMSTDQIILWLWQGTIIEFIIAYPMGKLLLRYGPRIKVYCEKI